VTVTFRGQRGIEALTIVTWREPPSRHSALASSALPETFSCLVSVLAGDAVG
jgi:hypothetical protein